MSYESSIVALYEGEIYGEHLFNTLSEAEANPEVAAMWKRAANVERLTGERVKPLAARFEADLDSQARAGVARAAAQAQEFAGQPWREVLTYYLGRKPTSLARIEAMAAQAREGDEPVLRQFVAHTQAFYSCIEHMLDDKPQDAMDALQVYLSG